MLGFSASGGPTYNNQEVIALWFQGAKPNIAIRRDFVQSLADRKTDTEKTYNLIINLFMKNY